MTRRVLQVFDRSAFRSAARNLGRARSRVHLQSLRVIVLMQPETRQQGMEDGNAPYTTA
jgi:hypothetical protein